MKKFLTSVYDAQREVIKSFVQKKEPTRLSNIAGTKVAEEGDIQFWQYKKMIENVEANTKEWRRYDEDSGKIVIEKNFFLNYIDKMSLFVFRPFDDYGKVKFVIPDNSIILEKYDSDITAILFFVAVLASWGIVTWLNISGWWVLFAAIAYIVIERSMYYRFVKRRKMARVQCQQDPSQLLSAASATYGKDTQSSESSVTFEYSNSKWWYYYDRTLREMVSIAAKLKGRVSWLYYYGNDMWDLAWNVEIERSSWHDNQRIEAKIEMPRHEHPLILLPVVETENSFIFLFSEYDKGMELPDEAFFPRPHQVDERLLIPYRIS